MDDILKLARARLQEAEHLEDECRGILSMIASRTAFWRQIVEEITDGETADKLVRLQIASMKEDVGDKTHSARRTNSKKKPTGKPNTLIYEEIVREHGRPMHITELLSEALLRGTTFNGKAPAKRQLWGALNSCARFYNTGGNRWWIDGLPNPEDTPVVHVDPWSNHRAGALQQTDFLVDDGAGSPLGVEVKARRWAQGL